MADKEKKAPKLLSHDERAKAADKAEKDAGKAEYKPRTAQDVARTVGAVQSDREKEKAADAGVTSVAFIDYEKALENYEAREDVEPLEERRARENGTSFHDAKFRRQVGGVDHTGVGTTDETTNKDLKASEAEGTKQ